MDENNCRRPPEGQDSDPWQRLAAEIGILVGKHLAREAAGDETGPAPPGPDIPSRSPDDGRVP